MFPQSAKEFTEIDHIVPIKEGGDNSLSNLQALCSDCHRKKHSPDTLYGHGHQSIYEPNYSDLDSELDSDLTIAADAAQEPSTLPAKQTPSNLKDPIAAEIEDFFIAANGEPVNFGKERKAANTIARTCRARYPDHPDAAHRNLTNCKNILSSVESRRRSCSFSIRARQSFSRKSVPCSSTVCTGRLRKRFGLHRTRLTRPG
jgi:hypothetical protein